MLCVLVILPGLWSVLPSFGQRRRRTGQDFGFIVIQEAGLDGFWIHRVIEREGIESHVVDPASIATSRRRRHAKTDKIDGEALVRALLAYKRGEPRVCAMVKPPSVEEEDQRRICRSLIAPPSSRSSLPPSGSWFSSRSIEYRHSIWSGRKSAGAARSTTG
jgi:transposase